MHSKPKSISECDVSLGRRAFIHRGTLYLAGTLGSLVAVNDHAFGLSTNAAKKRLLRFGIVTDLHYAEKEPAGTRHYREAPAKLREAIDRFRKDKAEFLVENGDFVDAAKDVETELAYLKKIDAEFARFPRDRHYVLGNHCVFTLTKEQFIANSGARKAHYSFDHGGVHFVVLDACYRKDGTPYGAKNFDWTDTEIPPRERSWLREDLASAKSWIIVFVHQRLDTGHPYGVKSASLVRRILEESGKVLAVFQGHSHMNEYREIGKIHYCTTAAMIEGSGEKNNAYALVDVYEDGTIRIDGFRKQKDYEF